MLREKTQHMAGAKVEINERGLPEVFFKARHFAVVVDNVLQFRYRINGDAFESFALTPPLLDMLKKLASASHQNVYALTEDAWKRLILFASSLEYINEKKKIEELKKAAIGISSIDILYWYSWLMDSRAGFVARSSVVRAFLTLLGFL
jgi:hypothetical protein